MKTPVAHKLNLIEDPVPELIRALAVPASVGFLFNTMYNVADTYFAGLISVDALAALSLGFPIFFIIIAMGAGISQGATALVANELGANQPDEACKYAAQAVAFSILLGLLLTAFGLWASPHLFRLLGAEEDYLEVCLAYMNVILSGTLLFLAQSVVNASLNASGDTKSYRNILIAGSILNLFLDPWFMWGGFGLPAMGVRGIALATLLIQLLGCSYLLTKVLRLDFWKDAHWTYLIPRRRYFKDIAWQGLPASLNMMTVALGIFVITWFISRFSKEGVAAYGIATRVEQIILLPTIGLNIAVLTLVGQNNGAGKPDRVRETWKTGVRYGLYLMIAGGIVLFPIAEYMMKIFTNNALVVEHGADYLRVAALTLASYVILYQTVFLLQGLKKPMFGLWMGLYRQILAPALVFYGLAYGLGWELKGIWWGIFGVTWSGALFAYFYGRWYLRRHF